MALTHDGQIKHTVDVPRKVLIETGLTVVIVGIIIKLMVLLFRDKN